MLSMPHTLPGLPIDIGGDGGEACPASSDGDGNGSMSDSFSSS
jgi:hypothetical protein